MTQLNSMFDYWKHKDQKFITMLDQAREQHSIFTFMPASQNVLYAYNSRTLETKEGYSYRFHCVNLRFYLTVTYYGACFHYWYDDTKKLWKLKSTLQF